MKIIIYNVSNNIVKPISALIIHFIICSSSLANTKSLNSNLNKNPRKNVIDSSVDFTSYIFFNGYGASAQLPFKLLNNLNQFTIDFWVNTTESRSSNIFWQRPTLLGIATAGDNSGDFAINTSNGYIGFYEGFSTQNTDQVYLSSHTKINDNTWHQISLVNDGANCKLYVDGLFETSLISGKKVITNAAPITLGAEALDNQITNAYYHQAKFSEVRISKSVRHNNNFTPEIFFNTDSNTLALFHFNGNCISSKNLDASNYHNDLVINNTDNNNFSLTNINSCSVLPFIKATSFNGYNQSAIMPVSFMNNYRKFTIETWIITKNITKSNNAIWQNPTIIGIENPSYPDGDFGIFTSNGYLGMYSGLTSGSVDDVVQTRAFIADSIWHQIALVGDSLFLNLFLDGIKVSQISMGRPLNTTLKGLGIMINNSTTIGFTAYQSGYLDELRFSDNIRYSSNFIPHKAPFTSDSNTLALFHFDSCFNNRLYDHSGKQNHADLQNIVCSLPVVTNFSPVIATTGTSVFIKGSGFTGATSITFGGIVASNFTILNDSTVTATVGNGASGSVAVTTPSGSGSLAGFVFCTLTSSTTNISICPSELPYLWNGMIFTGSANQSKHFTNVYGCDSVATLYLTVTQKPLPPAFNVCVGGTLQLTNIDVGGQWLSSNNKATVNQAGLVTGRNAGNAVITYKKNGIIYTYNITVNALPSVPSIQYATGTFNPQFGAPTGAFCINKSFGVVGIPNGGVFTVGNTSVLNIDCSGIVKTIGLGSSYLTYTYTDIKGCSNSRTVSGLVVNCAARSSDANEEQQVSEDYLMYPNPAKSFVIINTNLSTDASRLTISDVLGKQLKSAQLRFGINKIEIANLNKGLYFISIIKNGEKITKKLVVE